jgi:sugar phosphate isomerase/epimerase
MKPRLVLALFSLVALSPNALGKWELFAMDTGTRDGQTKTYEQQAALVKDLGFAGIGFTGSSKIPEMLAAVEKHGLEFSPLYNGLQVSPDQVTHPATLEQAITQLANREAIVWLYLGGKRPADPGKSDAPVVAKLRSLAEHAAKSQVRLALYPHAGAYADRIQDCVRLAKAVDRKNLGVTFNLCHFLKVDGKNVEQRLEEALPHLFAVTINGADLGAQEWKALIQPLDGGSYDVAQVLRKLQALKWDGPIGLQHYGIRGDARKNLSRSMKGWKALQSRLNGDFTFLLGPNGKLRTFEKPGDWKIMSDVRLDPKNSKRLIGEEGPGGEYLNGDKGRTVHLVTGGGEFGDVEAHIEFMISKGSNSGVYFQGRYEVQIYDSHGVAKDQYPGLECGGIYPRWVNNKNVEGHSPRVNVSKPPGEWQEFHVIFRAPRFKEGRKIANARFEKVWHNGQLIHENLELNGPTRAGISNNEKPTGPLLFQGDHGPIAYRNCWVVELSE